MSELVEEKVLIGYRADGTPITLTVAKLGEGEPRVFIGAVIHGDELTGLGSIWRLLEYLSGKEMKGTITVIPVMNPEGFNYSVRGIPGTLLDLNRLYPGDPDGNIAERITAKIWSIARSHDVVIDLHTADNCIPFILVDPSPPAKPEARRRSLELAFKSGVTVLDELPSEEYEKESLSSSLPAVAVANDIPGFTIELPSSTGTLDYNAVNTGFKVLKNILVALNIVDDTFEKITEYPVIIRENLRRERVRTRYNGIIEYRVSLGDKVAVGEPIAVVRDVLGRIVGEVRAPKEGYVVSIRREMIVWTGDNISTIAVNY